MYTRCCNQLDRHILLQRQVACFTLLLSAVSDEALEAGAKVGICSTSNEKAVQKIVDVMLSEVAAHIRVFAGDIVARKKPDPAIYHLAAQELGVKPSRCFLLQECTLCMQQ